MLISFNFPASVPITVILHKNTEAEKHNEEENV